MNATALTMVTNREGSIIVFNDAASELLVGKTSDEAQVKGRNILDFVIDEDKAKIIRLWKESVQEKKELSYPVRMKSFDGRTMYLFITGKPFIRDGEVVFFQYQALDIVDQKAQEQNLQQTASLETVGQLAGAFAHDFNNLLTVINGYSEIMLSTIDRTHPFYSKVYQICQAGSQASALTQKILDFSRKTRSSHQEVDINRELTDQEAILKHIIGANIDLVIEKKEGLDKVRVDSIQFSKMLLNLMLNAKEAMAKGGEIRITTD
ncbi:MAG: PAS domain S-box protein, partial [Methanotrichaceae archaeon]|nr:PAS domain S-box protein [Methanotrichaceae archaeon]